MPDNQRLGANFTIDVTDLKAGLLQANRLIKESESEFKAAAAGIGDWQNSADGLQARIKNLNTVIDLQQKKVDALRKEYKGMIDRGVDPASKAAVELRTKINQEQAALNKNEKELKQQTKALDEMGDESSAAAKDVDKLSKSAKDSGSGFSIAGGAIATFAGNVLTALVSKVGEAVSALFGLAESTRELRNEMNRLETGFTSNGLAAEDATNTYNDLYSVLGDTGKASEAAGHLALLANNSEDLAKWTDICTGVYAQFGDSLPIEGLTEAANETAKTGDLTGVLADALNWAGETEDEFQKKLDACTTEQERQKLITETLNGLYAEQSDKFKELNKDVIAAREAEAELAQAQADLGEAMEPLNTKITELKTSFLTELSPALLQVIDDLTDVLDGVEGAPERLANTVSSAIGGLLERVIEYIPKVGEFAIQLVAMLAQTIVENLPLVVEAAVQLFATFLQTLADMSPSLIMTITDAVVDMADTLIDNIDMIIDAGIKLIEGLAEGLIEAIPYLISKIPTIIQKLVEAIIRNLPKLVEAGIRLIGSLGQGLMDALPQLVSNIPQIISEMVNTLIHGGIPALMDVGKQLIKGLWDGIKSSFNWLGDQLNSFGNWITDKFKNLFGIHSPSRVFRDEIGSYLGEGMALGIGDGFAKDIGKVGKAVQRSAASMLDLSPSASAGLSAASGSAGRSVTINQYNTFASNRGSRYEQFKAKQNAAAAVRLAMAGGDA